MMFGGFPVYEFDGSNAAEIVELLGIEPGDVVIRMNDKGYLFSRSEFDKIFRAPVGRYEQ